MKEPGHCCITSDETSPEIMLESCMEENICTSLLEHGSCIFCNLIGQIVVSKSLRPSHYYQEPGVMNIINHNL